MSSKKTAKKAKKKVARKKKKVAEVEPALAGSDQYHTPPVTTPDPEAQRREKVMVVQKKLFEDVVAQAREFLDTELTAAIDDMKRRMETNDRELELLVAQEPGYMAYVLVASVARTVNRVRPDIWCKDLLALAKEIPR